MKKNLIPSIQKDICYHCGTDCQENNIIYEDKNFCCNGCKTVYVILSDNNLTTYYDWLEYSPKTAFDNKEQRFDFLDIPEIQKKIYQFQDDEICKIVLNLPTMHCSACVWLLENLYKINPAITYSRVDFQFKQLSITYLHHTVSLKEIVKLLTTLGYPPHFNLEDTHQSKQKKDILQKENRTLIGKISVAGFCFGNIMMASFPEYFGFDSLSVKSFKYLFQFINISLATFVFFYSGFGYIRAAYENLKKGFLNLDFPLALGIIVLFGRSLFEIFTDSGIGYLDTLAGLIFFLLLGKWFQQRTYKYLRYDRDFRSYFPMAITKIDTQNNENVCPIETLQKEDIILIKNNELIPTDAILISNEAQIDYSFVTGEAKPIERKQNDFIYAGGKNIGQNISLKVEKEVQQSYLTSLWNNQIFEKTDNKANTLQNILARYFTIGLIIIALTGLVFWGITENWQKAIHVFTSVLIIACPCALTLSAPFALGTAISILSKYGIYLKNTDIIQNIAQINKIVFDKTGTLTQTDKAKIVFVATENNLTNDEKICFWALAKNSVHVFSKQIELFLKSDLQNNNSKEAFEFSCNNMANLSNFKEEKGLGIEGFFGKDVYKMGAKKWLNFSPNIPKDTTPKGSYVYLQINEKIVGYFNIEASYRENMKDVIQNLQNKYELFLLSGDNESEKKRLSTYFSQENNLYFEQSPFDKQNFIQDLQQKNKAHKNKIMMIGDGLNDAGALKKADVGLAVTDNIAYFTPASDGIIEGKSIEKIPNLFLFAKKVITLIHSIFILSLFYNIFVLSVALSGILSPLIAAILMPISSVVFVVLATWGTFYHENIMK